MADDTPRTPDTATSAPASPARGSGAPDADIAASLRASRELGPEYDDAIAGAIVERLDESVDERVSRRLAEAGFDPENPRGAAAERDEKAWENPRLIMGLLAMCFVIPLSAIAGGYMGAAGVILAWVGTLLFYLISVLGTRR